MIIKTLLITYLCFFAGKHTKLKAYIEMNKIYLKWKETHLFPFESTSYLVMRMPKEQK